MENIEKIKNDTTAKAAESNELPGYPPYPASEDIFMQYKKEGSIDPEDITQTKAPNGVKYCAWCAAATVLLHQSLHNNFKLLL